MRKLWTPEEEKLFAEIFPHKQSAEVARMMGRSISSIRAHASVMGIKKSQAFYDDPKLSGRTDGSIGVASRFKSGGSSPNKGRSMSEWASEETIKRFRANSFKKGRVPHNTKEDGDITIRNVGGVKYKWIRISVNNWELYHRYIWHKAGRELKKGYNVVFKDGDSMNCTIENLELKSNEDLMAQNTIQRFPEEVKEVIRLLSKLKKKVKDEK